MAMILRSTAFAWVLALGTVLAIGAAAPASAQDYPSQTVKMIVPFTAGGGVDVVARVVAQNIRLDQ